MITAMAHLHAVQSSGNSGYAGLQGSESTGFKVNKPVHGDVTIGIWLGDHKRDRDVPAFAYQFHTALLDTVVGNISMYFSVSDDISDMLKSLQQSQAMCKIEYVAVTHGIRVCMACAASCLCSFEQKLIAADPKEA